MLESLDNINWKELKHAYGNAEDVPDLLRDLLVRDETVRSQAMSSLYGNIFHQGTRYEATPYAVPFLYEMLENDDTPDKPWIIRYLVHIAIGYPSDYIPNGFHYGRFRQELIEEYESQTAEEKADSLEFGYSVKAILKSYDNVKEGVPILYNLLGNFNDDIGNAAIYAMAWFPQLADNSLPHIYDKLPQLKSELDIAIALITIGLLCRNSKQKLDESRIKDYLESDSLLIRVSAAICLRKKTTSDVILAVLLEGIYSYNKLYHIEDFEFYGGQVWYYIQKILMERSGYFNEKVVPILLSNLVDADLEKSMGITCVLLTFLTIKHPELLSRAVLEDYSEFDKKILIAILKNGHFENANYKKILLNNGLPPTRQKLAYILEQPYFLNTNQKKSSFNFIRNLFGKKEK